MTQNNLLTIGGYIGVLFFVLGAIFLRDSAIFNVASLVVTIAVNVCIVRYLARRKP